MVRSWGRHDRISAVSAITVSPSQERVGLDFRLLPDDVNVHGEDAVDFLRELRRHLPVPMTVLWDRGNVHDRSKAVRILLADNPAVKTVAFPAYDPEANPGEGVLGYTKYDHLANFAPEDTGELRAALSGERTIGPSCWPRSSGTPTSPSVCGCSPVESAGVSKLLSWISELPTPVT